MSVLEQFKDAVNHAILLHWRLNEHVSRQKTLFDENRLDFMEGETRNGISIEQDLTKTNKTIAELFATISERNSAMDDSQRKFLAGLLDSLRTARRETMNLIERTGAMLQTMKRETAREIRELDVRRRAINSYGRNALTVNTRGMSR